MKIGDYVRTDNGCICKVLEYTDISDNDFYVNTDSPYNVIYKSWIVKSSPNIIDLIQVGDYVNGHKVVEVDLDDIDDYGNDFRYIKTEYDFTLNHWIKENEIESVLTKEQFERDEYKL